MHVIARTQEKRDAQTTLLRRFIVPCALNRVTVGGRETPRCHCYTQVVGLLFALPPPSLHTIITVKCKLQLSSSDHHISKNMLNAQLKPVVGQQQQLSVAARNAEALFEAKNVAEIRQVCCWLGGLPSVNPRPLRSTNSSLCATQLLCCPHRSRHAHGRTLRRKICSCGSWLATLTGQAGANRQRAVLRGSRTLTTHTNCSNSLFQHTGT